METFDLNSPEIIRVLDEGTGELDFNGTFESIWANHMDSLVPCKYCGRKFFPDRIERHENCCNNLSLRLKFKN